MARKTRKQQETPAPVTSEEQKARMEHMAAFFREQAAQVEPEALGRLVKSLKDVVERVERSADLSGEQAEWLRQNGSEPDSFATKVEKAQHDILWGLANLGLDLLISSMKRQREYLEMAARAEAEAASVEAAA